MGELHYAKETERCVCTDHYINTTSGPNAMGPITMGLNVDHFLSPDLPQRQNSPPGRYGVVRTVT
jgi:hypothetical protein